jgi:hypothetical protein
MATERAHLMQVHGRMEREKGVAKDKGSRARIQKATLDLQRQRKGGENRSSKVELSTKSVGNDIV